MKKLVWLAVVSGLAVSVAAWAQGPKGPRDGDHPGGGLAFGWILHDTDKAKEFGVTDEQLAKLRDAMYKHEQQMVKTRADLELARMEVRRLAEEAKPDTAAIDKAIDTASGLEAQMEKDRVHFMLQVKQVLGDETVAKIKAAMRERWQKEGRGDWKKSHGRGGDEMQGRGQDCPQAPAEPPQE